MNVAPLIAFMTERHAIYLRRERGDPWPWTKNSILRAYRFCNVFRNLDKETKLIHTHWLGPHGREPDVWFACVVARLINWWPTLDRIGYPADHWNTASKRFVKVCEERKAQNLKVFTGAYMVRADAHETGSKAAYLADFVLTPMWRDREHIRPREGDTLAAFHARLMLYRDMGSFMAAQVVADAKYFDTNLLLATDWQSWAAPGPGSLRGLNRVLGRPPNMGWGSKSKGQKWEDLFAEVHRRVKIDAPERFKKITGQDLQNCLCEFDKYERVRLGEGKPRSRYLPTLTETT